ncbi:hypothetical protein CEUSTIGMA_g9145.t1 [Chlamydomonas eustigma]|uniref:Uncharacterized protein n=1 Tax=Chlamydomonas eustigma TaxID=1157962 RepID=A0A250XF69_9CHLO|nr:hypothetical protein CEUSTIGMA_g9145.t1 [Chlamydomonas eustigma]|eukprot:GAX81717.1 hypothetical protein CEUSTIGMA_g9145.t1 [Chlamydomonas eustigma]
MANPIDSSSVNFQLSNESASDETGREVKNCYRTGFISLAQKIWTSMCTAWERFDKFAGYWLGLDTPKYQWAILEHQRRLKEEEDAILREESTLVKAALDEQMEGCASANVLDVVKTGSQQQPKELSAPGSEIMMTGKNL